MGVRLRRLVAATCATILTVALAGCVGAPTPVPALTRQPHLDLDESSLLPVTHLDAVTAAGADAEAATLLTAIDSGAAGHLAAAERAVLESGFDVSNDADQAAVVRTGAVASLPADVSAAAVVAADAGGPQGARIELGPLIDVFAAQITRAAPTAASRTMVRRLLLGTADFGTTTADAVRRALLTADTGGQALTLDDALRSGAAYRISSLQTLLLVGELQSVVIADYEHDVARDASTGSATPASGLGLAVPLAESDEGGAVDPESGEHPEGGCFLGKVPAVVWALSSNFLGTLYGKGIKGAIALAEKSGEAAGLGEKAIEASTAWLETIDSTIEDLGMIGLAADVLDLLISRLTLTVAISQQPDPLVRTTSRSSDGLESDVSAHFRSGYDYTEGDDAADSLAQLLTCVSRVLAMVGAPIDAELPEHAEDIKGASAKFQVIDQHPRAAFRPQPALRTDRDGVATATVHGLKHQRDVSALPPYTTTYTVKATVYPTTKNNTSLGLAIAKAAFSDFASILAGALGDDVALTDGAVKALGNLAEAGDLYSGSKELDVIDRGGLRLILDATAAESSTGTWADRCGDTCQEDHGTMVDSLHTAAKVVVPLKWKPADSNDGAPSGGVVTSKAGTFTVSGREVLHGTAGGSIAYTDVLDHGPRFCAYPANAATLGGVHPGVVEVAGTIGTDADGNVTTADLTISVTGYEEAGSLTHAESARGACLRGSTFRYHLLSGNRNVAVHAEPSHTVADSDLPNYGAATTSVPANLWQRASGDPADAQLVRTLDTRWTVQPPFPAFGQGSATYHETDTLAGRPDD